MEDLLSDDEEIRTNAFSQLKSIASSDFNSLINQIPNLLEIITKSKHPLTTLQVAGLISDALTNQPAIISNNFDAILAAVDELSSNDLLDDQDIMTGVIMHLLTLLQTDLRHEANVMKSFPTLLKLMSKQSSIKWSAYSPISTLLLTNPAAGAQYTEDLLGIIQQFPQLLMILPNLYSSSPGAFASKINVLIEIYKSQPDQQAGIVRILGDLAKDDHSMVVPYLDVLLPGLNSLILSYQTISILSTIATADPLAVYPHLDAIKRGVSTHPAIVIEAANTLSLIGRVSNEHATEILLILMNWLSTSDQVSIPLILSEIRNLVELNKGLIANHMVAIRKYTESPQEAIRDQAILIVDIFEGRDIHSLADQIDDQNKKISEIVKSLDDLRNYVDENIDMIKDFIAEIAKKLPIPISFSTEGRMRKTLILHFVCHTQTDRCLYPDDRAFTSETKVINRWLKIAFSAVKLGKAVILPPSAGDAIKAVKEAYDSYKDKNEDDFLDFIKQPFLTSTEQDSLIDQLRDANFFNVFVYDSRDTDWNCIMCKS